jgi:hypothetical protein
MPDVLNKSPGNDGDETKDLSSLKSPSKLIPNPKHDGPPLVSCALRLSLAYA